jgi:hypothetical protein
MSTQGASESKPPVDKEKSRKLMRFWAIGTFIVTFASVTTYAGTLTKFLIFRQPLYWVFVVVSAIATVAVLAVHEWWLRRQ